MACVLREEGCVCLLWHVCHRFVTTAVVCLLLLGSDLLCRACLFSCLFFKIKLCYQKKKKKKSELFECDGVVLINTVFGWLRQEGDEFEATSSKPA